MTPVNGRATIVRAPPVKPEHAKFAAEMDRRDPNADGIWDDEMKTIYLRKRLPVTRRRYILAHELGHAWLDWQHRHLDNGKART